MLPRLQQPAGRPQTLAAVILVAGCAATVGTALVFEHVFGYQPCALCLEQRTPYYVSVIVALLAAFAGAGRAPGGIARGLLGLVGLAMLYGLGLAIYHSGVEWHFWQGPTDCSGPVADLGSAGSLLSRLDTVKVIRCDEVQFRFLGISLAGYSVLISLAMAAIAGWGISKTAKA